MREYDHVKSEIILEYFTGHYHQLEGEVVFVNFAFFGKGGLLFIDGRGACSGSGTIRHFEAEDLIINVLDLLFLVVGSTHVALQDLDAIPLLQILCHLMSGTDKGAKTREILLKLTRHLVLTAR